MREGIAEAIPLPDASVDAVTVADGFHWFDQARALVEIDRVLRPGGGLAVISTVPDWSGASWAHELGTLVEEVRPEHPAFDGPPWQEAVRAAGGWTEPRQIRVTTSQPADPAPDRRLGCVDELRRRAAGGRADGLARPSRRARRGGETPAELPVHFVVGLTTPSDGSEGALGS